MYTNVAVVSRAGAQNAAVLMRMSSMSATQDVGVFVQSAIVDGSGSASLSSAHAIAQFLQEATILAGDSPLVTTTTLADAVVSVSYSATLVATGSTPITWSVVSGSLPAGISLNASTGALTGVPTTPVLASFTVRATNATGFDEQALELLVPNGAGGSEIVYPERTATAEQTIGDFTQVAAFDQIGGLTASQTIGDFTQVANIDIGGNVSVVGAEQLVGAFPQAADIGVLVSASSEHTIDAFSQQAQIRAVEIVATSATYLEEPTIITISVARPESAQSDTQAGAAAATQTHMLTVANARSRVRASSPGGGGSDKSPSSAMVGLGGFMNR